MDKSTHSDRDAVSQTNEELHVQVRPDGSGILKFPAGTPVAAILKAIDRFPDAKAIHVGSPYGAIIPIALGHLLSDYAPPPDEGTPAPCELVLLSHKQCVVKAVRRSVNTFLARSRSQACASCGENFRQVAAILKRISSGQGRASDLGELEEIGRAITSTCQCSVGKLAAGPLLNSLRGFQKEYQEHVDGHCYALACKKLLRFEVVQAKCQGERCCLPCPDNAIQGSFGKPAWIVEDLCSKCGKCVLDCPYDAIRVYS